ncbi:MAG: RNA polymerase sigma factor RpoD/SigA [Fibrobacteria bacterium]|nr:RNA polymerase sigma factor RpoD/SigA [Fibrobacteria bacterium]
MVDTSEKLYFRDLERYNLLAPAEEKALIQRIKHGDQKALQDLIVGNLRFVVSIAKRYQGRGLNLLELINEGSMGLHKAAKRFDDKKGVKFISYAVWWIRQTIQKALFEQVGAIRIPPNKLALMNRFKKALLKNNGNMDETLEMEEFKVSRLDIIEVMNKVMDISLDAPIKDMSKSATSLLDMIGGEGDQVRESERNELRMVVDNVLNSMSDSEQKVLRMYYGINYSHEFTLDEIGKELKLTRERVRQIKNKALNKLLRSKESKEKLTPFTSSHDTSAKE